jgi:hypothetical protein
VPFKFFAFLFFCESASYLNFVSDEPFCLFEFLHGVYLASIIYCSCMGRLQNLTWLILASVLFMNEAHQIL